jgi:hypothetical protein
MKSKLTNAQKRTIYRYFNLRMWSNFNKRLTGEIKAKNAIRLMLMKYVR